MRVQFSYGDLTVEKTKITAKEDVLLNSAKSVSWFNLYCLTHSKEVQHIVKTNNLDGFISTLLEDTSHRTKVVELDESFFFTAKSVHSSEDHALTLEQMMFVVSDDFV